MGRTLGVDPGQRRVGLALDDEAGQSMALPFGTVERGKNDAEAARRVAEALAEVEVEAVVVGLPLRLSGTEGTAARKARLFGSALEEALGVPVTYQDERLTTVAAERTLRDMGVRGQAQRRVVDETAAALVLQSYLDGREYRRRHAASREGSSETPWPDASDD